MSVVRQGVAHPEELPRSDRTVLVLPASDVLLLQGAWPHLGKLSVSRWKEVLPHLIEESLATPAEWCHFAPSSAKGVDGQWTVAVVDRAWMRHLHRQFFGPGRGALHMVSSAHLQPENTLMHADVSGTDEVVVSWRGSNLAGWGIRMRREDLSVQAGWPGMPSAGLVAQAGGLESWVRTSVPEQAIDLCQYEFFSRAGGGWGQWYAWRHVMALAGLALVVQLAGLNLYWLKLHFQERHLQQAMQQLARTHLPSVPDGVSPLMALRRAMDTHDQQDPFLMRLAALSRLLDKVPGDAVQSLDYQGDVLKVHFKPGFRAEGLKPQVVGLGLRWKAAEPGVWVLEAGRP